MITFLLSFSIFYSGVGVEKLITPTDIVFARTGQSSRIEAILIIPNPNGEDISPIDVSAGEDIVTCVGSRVTLSAARTHDPLGCGLSYRWFFYSRPMGSGAVLWHNDSMNPEFNPDLAGEYYLTLEVRAEDGRTGADTIVVVAEDCNGYPRAVITTEKTVVRPGEVSLSAEGSSCVNDEIISYEWDILQRPSGSETTIGGSVVAYMVVDQIGLYQVRLTVRTRKGFSDMQTIDLRCIDGFIPPVYAYSQELLLRGVMGITKKTAILIEFPNGMGDLTGVAVYGRKGVKVDLLGTVKLQQDENSFRKVLDYYEDVYVVGMIHEKMVLVKYCDRF